MNAQQLFFALMESDETHELFIKDHQPVWKGYHWFIKELHENEGVQQAYDFEEIQRNINDGYFESGTTMMMVDGITDKYYRDGCH